MWGKVFLNGHLLPVCDDACRQAKWGDGIVWFCNSGFFEWSTLTRFIINPETTNKRRNENYICQECKEYKLWQTMFSLCFSCWSPSFLRRSIPISTLNPILQQQSLESVACMWPYTQSGRQPTSQPTNQPKVQSWAWDQNPIKVKVKLQKKWKWHRQALGIWHAFPKNLNKAGRTSYFPTHNNTDQHLKDNIKVVVYIRRSDTYICTHMHIVLCRPDGSCSSVVLLPTPRRASLRKRRRRRTKNGNFWMKIRSRHNHFMRALVPDFSWHICRSVASLSLCVARIYVCLPRIAWRECWGHVL